MAEALAIEFQALSGLPQGTFAVLAGQELTLGALARSVDEKTKGAIQRAARAADFTGKPKTAIEILAPPGLDAARIVVVGIGRTQKELERLVLGGFAFAQLNARKAESASLLVDPVDPGEVSADVFAADLAMGALLRSYNFRKYQTRKPTAENGAESEFRNGLRKLTVYCAKPDAAARAFAARRAVAEGVFLARDLVNEPANKLGPVEFAERMRELASSGLEVEVLEVEQLEALKMNALLAVGMGSQRPARVVVLYWHGAKSKRAKTLCFAGKGVCFDTGGISIKPAGGMEDMKGDMGGAACVAGLMLTLARRKAPVNVAGLLGLVENMPSGTAQRPGDIVASMSGQTIEVLNTDAEGRLVLADLLWYAQERFKPRFIIDLATLTGAILVALGKEYAGLFTNDDRLAQELAAAGQATGEQVWRLPLNKAYDKLIDSKIADVKNIGGRHAGSITAAQFLQRFVKDVPWAHLDVAGTAIDGPRNDINQSWGSGWGVRLLDRFIAENYEKAERS
jgi:leucyl aminopeptidase